MLRWPSIAASIAQFIGAAIAAASIGQWAGAQNGIPCRYEISHVIQGPYCGGFGYPPTFGTGISPNGRYVCGYYNVCTIGNARAFVYDTQAQQFTGLPHPQGVTVSYAWDVSDAGKVVGKVGGTGNDNGYIYDMANGQYMLIPPAVPSNGTCTIAAINSNTVVCGTRTIQASPHRTNAFIWSAPTGVVDLGVLNGPSSGAVDINDEADVLGWIGTSSFSPTTRVFTQQKGQTITFGPIPGGINSVPQAINNSGQCLVWGQMSDGLPRSFVWTQGAFAQLLPLIGYDTVAASSLDDAAMVVGYSYVFGSNNSRACAWLPCGPHDLHSLIAPATNAEVSRGAQLSDVGVVVAEGFYYYGQDGYAEAVFALTPDANVWGDSTCDLIVNVSDLLAVIGEWGTCCGCGSDFNIDNQVNVYDLLVVINNWSR